LGFEGGSERRRLGEWSLSSKGLLLTQRPLTQATPLTPNSNLAGGVGAEEPRILILDATFEGTVSETNLTTRAWQGPRIVRRV